MRERERENRWEWERESAIMLCIKHLLSASMEGRNECKKKEGNISIYIYIYI